MFIGKICQRYRKFEIPSFFITSYPYQLSRSDLYLLAVKIQHVLGVILTKLCGHKPCLYWGVTYLSAQNQVKLSTGGFYLVTASVGSSSSTLSFLRFSFSLAGSFLFGRLSPYNAVMRSCLKVSPSMSSGVSIFLGIGFLQFLYCHLLHYYNIRITIASGG